MAKIVRRGTFEGLPVAELDNGEIIDLSDSVDRVQREVESRGSLAGSIKKNWQSGGLRKGLAGLQVLAAPYTLPVSGISNSLLSIQQGKDPAMAGFRGITGQTQAGMGDVLRSAADLDSGRNNIGDMAIKALTNPLVAGAADITVGVGAGKMVGKGLDIAKQGIRKLLPFDSVLTKADKKMIQMGDKFIKEANEIVKGAGEKLKKIFSPYDKMKVIIPKDMLKNSLGDKTFNLLDKTARELFNEGVDDILSNNNIESLRKLKIIYGKINPTQFGVDEAGKATSAANEIYNRGYKYLSDMLKEGLKVNKVKAEDIAKLTNETTKVSNLYRSEDIIQKAIIDPTTKWATKMGSAAEKMQSGKDATLRQAIDYLRQSGLKRDYTRDAVYAMKEFIMEQQAKQALNAVGRYALLGGAAGTAGAMGIKGIAKELGGQ